MRALPPVLLALALLAAAPAVLPAQSPTAAGQTIRPTAAASLDTIFDGALRRARTQDEAGAELWFESIVETTIDKLDGDGAVTQTDTTRHRRYPLEGAVFEELVERNGEPLDTDALRDEAEKREAFRRDAIEAAENGTQLETNDERQVRFDADLMSRYDARLIGEELLGNERCWVIAFQPRDGDLPERNRMDKVLNQSAGRVFIAQEDFGIRQIEFELLRPVRYLWGLIASLSRATGRLEFERVETGVWLPRQFDLRIDLRVLFRTNRQQIHRRWVERDRLDGTATSGF